MPWAALRLRTSRSFSRLAAPASVSAATCTSPARSLPRSQRAQAQSLSPTTGQRVGRRPERGQSAPSALSPSHANGEAAVEPLIEKSDQFRRRLVAIGSDPTPSEMRLRVDAGISRIVDIGKDGIDVMAKKSKHRAQGAALVGSENLKAIDVALQRRR